MGGATRVAPPKCVAPPHRPGCTLEYLGKLDIRVGLSENANSFFATRCCFWSCKNSGFPGNAVHKAALHSQMLLYQALQSWWNENETNRTNHRRLASRKGGVWKNESLSESFGSRRASKVKINAYCFLTLHACQPVVGDSQNQNMNLS